MSRNDRIDLKGDSLTLIHLVVNAIYNCVFMHAMLLGHHEKQRNML